MIGSGLLAKEKDLDLIKRNRTKPNTRTLQLD